MTKSNQVVSKSEQKFGEVYAATHDREKAEKAAGLAPRSGYQLLGRPRVQTFILQQERGRLAEIVQHGNQWALETLKDKDKPDTIKRDIWRESVRLFMGNEKAQEGASKESHEMSADELAAAIAELEAAAARLAKPIEETSDSADSLFE